MQIERKHIVSFFKEIIIVVAGVLIAVSISNYKEKVDNKRFINKTLGAIEKEIRDSRVNIESVMKRHLEIADSVNLALEDSDESINQMLTRLGGIQSAEVGNIGLRFFISHRAELVEYEIISQMSEIEITSNMLRNKIDKLIDYTYDVIERKDKLSKQKFLVYLTNVIDSENTLMMEFDAFLGEEDGESSEEK